MLRVGGGGGSFRDEAETAAAASRSCWSRSRASISWGEKQLGTVRPLYNLGLKSEPAEPLDGAAVAPLVDEVIVDDVGC